MSNENIHTATAPQPKGAEENLRRRRRCGKFACQKLAEGL